MKIGIYIENYIAGGVETVVCNKIRNWPDNTDEFYIIVNDDNEGVEKVFRRLSEVTVSVDIKKVKIYSMPKLAEQHPRFALLFWIVGIYLRHVFVLLNFLRLCKLFESLRLDTLFVHNGGHPGGYSCFSAVLASRRQNIKNLYYIVHNLAAPKRVWQLPFDYFYDRLVNRVTEIIFVSQASKNVMLNNRGIGADAYVIPNGVEPLFTSQKINTGLVHPDYDVSRKAFQIAMVARFDESKGHKILFQALSCLKNESNLNIKLNLYGSSKGEKAINIVEQIERYDLTDLCQVHNFVDNVQLELLNMDCLILPSLEYESMPMSIIEAMSVGLPVIASDVGGVSELIRNEIDGLVVPAGNPAILSSKILDLYMDTSKRERMKQSALARYFEKFSATLMSTKYHQLSTNMEVDWS